jgi:AcrR family transcriptional regulator
VDGVGGAVRSGRRPGNQDTRGTILSAARTAFAAKGFSGASIRGIAADAGVDAALVHHYFGTKQELFLATVELPVPIPEIFASLLEYGLDGFGLRLLETTLGIWESDAQPALVAGLRSIIADPAMTRSMREFATAELIGRVIDAYDLPRAEAERRAGLVAAQLLGLFTARYLLELPAAVAPSRAELVAAVGPTLQRYLDGDFGRPATEPPEPTEPTEPTEFNAPTTPIMMPSPPRAPVERTAP